MARFGGRSDSMKKDAIFLRVITHSLCAFPRNLNRTKENKQANVQTFIKRLLTDFFCFLFFFFPCKLFLPWAHEVSFWVCGWILREGERAALFQHNQENTTTSDQHQKPNTIRYNHTHRVFLANLYLVKHWDLLIGECKWATWECLRIKASYKLYLCLPVFICRVLIEIRFSGSMSFSNRTNWYVLDLTLPTSHLQINPSSALDIVSIPGHLWSFVLSGF